MNCRSVSRWFGTSLALGVVAAGAWAGPLDKGRLDAGTRWVVHIDVEAAMRSTAGKFISEPSTVVNLGPLEEFKARTGLDVFRDILDVTVYGMTDASDDAVAIIRGRAKLEPAVEEVMKELPEVERKTIGGRAGFRWIEDGVARFGCIVGSTPDGPRDFVVAREVARLEQAIQVLSQTAPSLQGAENKTIVLDPKPGSIVFVVAADLSKAMAHAPKVLRGASNFRMDVGEDGDGMYAEATLGTATETEAETIVDFGRGMLAIGRLACAGESDLKGLSQVIDGVKIETDGPRLKAFIRVGRDVLEAALADVKSEVQAAKKQEPAIEKTSQEKQR